MRNNFQSNELLTVPTTDFLRGSWISSLFVKGFLTVNQRKTAFQDNVLGDIRF